MADAIETRRTTLRGGDDAVEDVRRPCERFRTGAVGEDGELMVELHRLGVDDDAVEIFGQRQCKGGFPARRRPGDHDDGNGHRGAGVPLAVTPCRS